MTASKDEPMMRGSHYLVRFDDICPTMNWTAWDGIEAHLVRHQVKPIMAVVPDNQDPNLMVAPHRHDFWDQVRKWQAMGWTIALHGYQHVYSNQNPGMLKLTAQSEFAGLPEAEQEDKLRKGLAIFASHGVRVDAWVAPSHSFDRTTVKVLARLGVSVISDGLWTWPFSEEGPTTWIPQQLWSFRSKGRGIWTVCNHHNDWSERKVERFGRMLELYAPRMTDVPTVLQAFAGRKQSWLDRWTAYQRLLWNLRVRSFLGGIAIKVLRPRLVQK